MPIYNSIYPLDLYDKGVPNNVKRHAPSVCVVAAVGQKFLSAQGLKTRTSGYYYNINDPRYPDGGQGKLCKYPGEETAVWMTGTAFAVSRKKFVTAKHVVEDILEEVNSKNDKDLRIVSGYYRKSSPSSSFKYTFLKVESVELYANTDLAVIITSNALPSSAIPLTLADTKEQKRVAEKDGIYMLGYPLGQAQKYSTGVTCDVDAGELNYFKGWISSFAGNSGSPVFSSKTDKVIGVMVSGSANTNDWVKSSSENCWRYATAPMNPQNHADFLYVDNLGF